MTASEESIASALLAWYDRHARALPWRSPPGEAPPEPYRVWLSEVMLQQTTTAAVSPYFKRFIDKWPTVEALAAAPDEDVMAAWAGLGYYSRARNLIAAAKAVVERGGFPDTEAELRELPGVGAYIAAAVAATVDVDRRHGVLAQLEAHARAGLEAHAERGVGDVEVRVREGPVGALREHILGDAEPEPEPEQQLAADQQRAPPAGPSRARSLTVHARVHRADPRRSYADAPAAYSSRPPTYSGRTAVVQRSYTGDGARSRGSSQVLQSR